MNNNDMKIKVLFTALLLAVSFSLLSGAPQSNDSNGQVNQGAVVISTNTIQNKTNDSLTSLINIAGQLYITDTLMLSEIKQNTARTAENTEDGVYEDQSLCYAEKSSKYSFIAMIVALVTLIVTTLTLLYQRKTKNNTESLLFTKDNQYEAAIEIAYQLSCNLIEAYITTERLQKCEKNSIPSMMLFPLGHIDASALHIELFYCDNMNKGINRVMLLDKIQKTYKILSNKHKNNKMLDRASNLFQLASTKEMVDLLAKPSQYAKMSRLKEDIVSYNETCAIIAKQIQNQTIEIESLKSLYKYYILENDLFSLLRDLVETMNDVNDYKKKGDLRVYIVRLIVFDMIAQNNLNINNSNNNWEFTNNKGELNEELRKIEEMEEGICNLVDETKKKWEELFMGFDFSVVIPTMKFDLDIFMHFVKLWIIGNKTPKDMNDNYEKSVLDTPYIKYEPKN